MDIKIQAIHFEATEKLEDFIQKKVAKLERFHDEIGRVEVSLKVVKPESALNKQADVKVFVPGKELFATETCDTFEESVNKACEILVRQLEKHKNK